ncbi:hypothetical protein SAMN04489716_7013 [Actinoplanes derwentensis]|uniref:2'-5' RNA ligase superfamily protein n=1 Tax=Actinoplanes derwentensis TaxID=113562 RepID=A0A1H2CVJ0_9ACTN|nr:hypothetical protein SAMN04489716_7013 [Actinoplanes derwentensis]
MPAGTLTAGPALAATTAVMLDIDGDQPGQLWTTLTTSVRQAITDVLGSKAVANPPGPPHITLAYGIGDTDSGPIQGALRHRARPARAPLTIDAVYLVDVIQDPQQAVYHWSTVTSFLLG